MSRRRATWAGPRGSGTMLLNGPAARLGAPGDRVVVLTYCLVDQGFVKRNSEVSVKEHVAQISKQLGDEIAIRRFVRFQVGEVTA